MLESKSVPSPMPPMRAGSKPGGGATAASPRRDGAISVDSAAPVMTARRGGSGEVNANAANASCMSILGNSLGSADRHTERDAKGAEWRFSRCVHTQTAPEITSPMPRVIDQPCPCCAEKWAKTAYKFAAGGIPPPHFCVSTQSPWTG
jgi:hypothetical protein